MNKYRITDTNKAYDYQSGFDNLSDAIGAAVKRPVGIRPYIIMDNNGRSWNLSEERVCYKD